MLMYLLLVHSALPEHKDWLHFTLENLVALVNLVSTLIKISLPFAQEWVKMKLGLSGSWHEGKRVIVVIGVLKKSPAENTENTENSNN